MDPYNLTRFITAQNEVYAQVTSELRHGRKRSHWIWFIFPQIAGLGSSPMSREYSIRSLEEAKAYLKHPTLGPRLLECCRLVLEVQGRTAEEILGAPDDLKFRSSLTLFLLAEPKNDVFKEALVKYYGGEGDPLTLRACGVALQRPPQP